MSERPDTEPLPDDVEIPAYEDNDTEQTFNSPAE